MAIIVDGLNSYVNDKENAWYQIIDDINSSNFNNIKSLKQDATLYIDSKLSIPLGLADSTYVDYNDIIDELDNASNKLNYNETQRKNLDIKILNWLNNDCANAVKELNTNKKVLAIFNLEKLGKHEWVLFNVLNKLGVNILVITKDSINKNITRSNAKIITYGTNENISLNDEKQNQTYADNKKKLLDNDIKSDTVLEFINNTKNNIKLVISGYSEECNTSIIAAKLKNNSGIEDNSIFFDNNIVKPSVEEASKIYKLNRDNKDYIIQTTKLFIKNSDRELQDKLISNFVLEMNSIKDSINSAQVLYNIAVNIVCWLNKYVINKNTRIVYYGTPKNTEYNFLNILINTSDINVILLSSSELNIKIINKDIINIKLKMFKQNENLEYVSTNNVSTLAYEASKRAEKIMFGDDSIGLIKEGMIKDCKSKHMSCTYDEIANWWNVELQVRPGFKRQGDKVEIPTIFSIIRGVKDTKEEYLKKIEKFACGKSIYLITDGSDTIEFNETGKMRILHCVDVNMTRYDEQEKFVIKDKLQIDAIKRSKNYSYSFLDEDKQNFILSKIQELIDDKMIFVPDKYKNSNYSNNKYSDDYYDLMLNMLLNLDKETLRIIQWFNYTGYNPNVIVCSTDENIMSFSMLLLIRFFNKLGFDILIFVPTCYNSVEKYLNYTEYDKYDIGRPMYDVDVTGIEIRENNENYVRETQKKKGILSKFFK